MSVVSFVHLAPEVARAELREMMLCPIEGAEDSSEIPPGRYAFLENYCIDPACDCRRVIISVMSQSSGRIVATISHSFEKPGPQSLAPVQTFLDPLNPQAPYAEEILELFLDRVLDSLYAARLERHYRLAKVTASDPKHPIHQMLRDGQRGSRPGKKSKSRKRDRRNKRGRR